MSMEVERNSLTKLGLRPCVSLLYVNMKGLAWGWLGRGPITFHLTFQKMISCVSRSPLLLLYRVFSMLVSKILSVCRGRGNVYGSLLN